MFQLDVLVVFRTEVKLGVKITLLKAMHCAVRGPRSFSLPPLLPHSFLHSLPPPLPPSLPLLQGGSKSASCSLVEV